MPSNNARSNTSANNARSNASSDNAYAFGNAPQNAGRARRNELETLINQRFEGTGSVQDKVKFQNSVQPWIDAFDGTGTLITDDVMEYARGEVADHAAGNSMNVARFDAAAYASKVRGPQNALARAQERLRAELEGLREKLWKSGAYSPAKTEADARILELQRSGHIEPSQMEDVRQAVAAQAGGAPKRKPAAKKPAAKKPAAKKAAVKKPVAKKAAVKKAAATKKPAAKK